jgi:hypothetical protein
MGQACSCVNNPQVDAKRGLVNAPVPAVVAATPSPAKVKRKQVQKKVSAPQPPPAVPVPKQGKVTFAVYDSHDGTTVSSRGVSATSGPEYEFNRRSTVDSATVQQENKYDTTYVGKAKHASVQVGTIEQSPSSYSSSSSSVVSSASSPPSLAKSPSSTLSNSSGEFSPSGNGESDDRRQRVIDMLCKGLVFKKYKRLGMFKKKLFWIDRRCRYLYWCHEGGSRDAYTGCVQISSIEQVLKGKFCNSLSWFICLQMEERPTMLRTLE